ncbi:hypothetical protein N7516_011391 [Penicillium verrucosum]|uniref:uncharacterized protein n=1 Tax=Penicillium verrucosum TaxID=60171 RepID=UPI0025455C42|nr:uncharacterized protein N7516_011391 [Penicillium verrucosum]KAJ5920533.1 hypothetical protein N7516_011391 [Penicillium verrucosum]
MSLGRVYTDDILTIHPRSKDDSFAVEIIHAVADKGPVWALELAGVVLLCLLLKEVGVFFFWWARYAIKRRDDQRDRASGGASGGAAGGSGAGGG